MDLKYHHLGIPTTEKKENEKHIEHLGMHVSGYEESPYNIEWMRFDPGSPIPELVQRIPHVAFEVENLDEAIKDKEVIIPPNEPSGGVRVAFIVDNGAPVEFLEYVEE